MFVEFNDWFKIVNVLANSEKKDKHITVVPLVMEKVSNKLKIIIDACIFGTTRADLIEYC